MFDELVAGVSGTRGASAVRAWARVENAACARRLASMVVILDDAHAADGSAERDQWCLDNWGAVSAHIGAAQCITRNAAASVLLVAVALRDRFPRVAALFADGLIDYRMARAAVTRGANVVDAEALRSVDEALTDALSTREPMSAHRAEQTVDAIVARFDPHAMIRTETMARGRSVDIATENGNGLATVFATLFATDAHAFDQRIHALAETVCRADPRTKDQRRADAMGALARGADRLACLCDTEGCPATKLPPSSGVVVYVVAHQDIIAEPATSADSVDECAGLDGNAPPLFDRPLRELTLTEALTDRTPARLSTIPAAAVMGGGLLPGAVARRCVRGARPVPIVHPGNAQPEAHYRPSKVLADFVRCRDLTCRFPGCRVPAAKCDVDHTIPWPYGATQASNLKCLCRSDHLLKTFWGGEGGWRERQLPDGSVVWSAPDGQTYTTTPGSRLLFPSLCEPTAPVVATAVPAGRGTSGLTMPRRRRTRAEDRARRISDQRAANAADVTASPVEEPIEPDADADSDPPPF